MLELQTKYAEIQNLLFQASENYKSATNQMLQLLFIEEQIQPFDTTMELYSIEVKTAGPDKFYPFSIMDHYSRISNLKQAELNYEKAKLFPEISLGYFNQDIDHVKGFQGVTAGLIIPLWFYPQKARIKEAQIMHKISRNDLEYNKFTLQKKIEDLRGKLDQFYIQISFYRENVLVQCDMLENIVRGKFKNNLIGDSEYMQNISAICIKRIEYLEKIRDYNTTAIELEYYVK
jgi:cobalt-zinc-cadmium resistance protein CzcA